MSLEEYIAQHYSHRSARGYISQIERFKAHFDDESNGVSYRDIIDYIGVLRSRGVHPKTLRNHLFSIKIYFRYLVSMGKRNDHPCESLYLKDQINRAIAVEDLYSKKKLEELYQDFENLPYRNNKNTEPEIYRDKIILSLLVYQALTPMEIVELKVDDINLEEGAIQINENNNPGRRGNKPRNLPLKSSQFLLIQKYLDKHRKSLWRGQRSGKRLDYFLLLKSGLQLYPTYTNIILAESGFTPMKIRQSVIANLLKENNDIRIVQEFAGHRRTSSTEAYKQTGLEELRLSVEKLHPRR